jgi:hypothetical protein
MKQFIYRFLADEERAANFVIWGCAALGAFCFLASLVAMAVLR